MLKFFIGLFVGLSLASASADIVILQSNGQFAVMKTTVAAGVHTLNVVCQ